MKNKEKEVLSAKVSKKAAAGWRSFCARNGITVSAFIEVTGSELAKESLPLCSDIGQRLVTLARQIDIERRARR